MYTNVSRLLMIVATVGVVTSGCATKSYVRTEVGDAETRSSDRIASVESLVEQNQEMLTAQEGEIDRLSAETAELSKTAQDALERAVAAGKLAEGKFLYETILSDDSVRFDFDRAELSGDAQTALDAFSSELMVRNEGVYIEIQGHTDATGTEDYNLNLGEKRAESVLRYLNARHGLPLHRMSAISYGESAPLVENSTPEARAKNRRVALVVLK